MAATNHERVGKALDLLKAGLGPARARTVQRTQLGSTRNSGSGWPAARRSRRAAGMPNPYRWTSPSTRIASARMGLR